MKVGDIIEWKEEGHEPHRWKVNGIHLGGVGVESLIQVENISHKPGWTGEWETHQMMFIPEVLLRGCRVVR